MTPPRSDADNEGLREVLIHTICPHIKRWCDETDDPVTTCENCPSTVQTSYGEGVQMCRLNAEAAADAILALAPSPSPAAGPVADLTNHHNALKCPYCNPQGLSFASPPVSDASREALEYIDMAENRLECADCPECVKLAVSFLQEARKSLSNSSDNSGGVICQNCGDPITDALHASGFCGMCREMGCTDNSGGARK